MTNTTTTLTTDQRAAVAALPTPDLNLAAYSGERMGSVLRRLLDAEAEADRLRERVAELERDRSPASGPDTDAAGYGAYRERAHLLAWLAAHAVYEAVMAPATDVDDPGWHLLYLYAGGRQLSWHIHPDDVALFSHVPHVNADHPLAAWDGHTTHEKYAHIRRHTHSLADTPHPDIAKEIP